MARIIGFMFPFQVPGNFHISTHSASSQPENPDMAHIVHSVTFGDKSEVCIDNTSDNVHDTLTSVVKSVTCTHVILFKNKLYYMFCFHYLI